MSVVETVSISFDVLPCLSLDGVLPFLCQGRGGFHSVCFFNPPECLLWLFSNSGPWILDLGGSGLWSFSLRFCLIAYYSPLPFQSSTASVRQYISPS